MFRSLFSWIMLVGLNRSERVLAAKLVVSILVLLDQAGRPQRGLLREIALRSFDPCSTGSGSAAAASACRRIVHRAMFRSLFSWIRLVGLEMAAERTLLLGFDPCSPGSGWAARRAWLPNCVSRRFRSLFSWIRLGDCPDEDLCSATGVSILVLLDQARRPRTASRPLAIGQGFDPCSPGSGSSAVHRPCRSLGLPRRVSILVLLDQAASAGRDRAKSWRSLCFDPCSPGSGSAATASSVESVLLARSFDPCSPGSGSAATQGVRRWQANLGFRSLFSWIRLGDRHRADGASDGLGFDPCSPGSGWAAGPTAST